MYPNVRTQPKNLLPVLELCIIIGLAVVPLFISFPYRINIFLSWEGAYRLSQGQVPYRDFGMPLGYMYWVVPALFFKIFGPQLIILVKAQVFLNIISGLAFRSILKSLQVEQGIRFLTVLLYCVSFSFFNFWPWYNHTVIVYQMVALAFLMPYLMGNQKWWLLTLSALFTFFSFFTKQDGGGLSFVLSLAMLLYVAVLDKRWKGIAIYIISFLTIALLFILPLTQYNFKYWFNYGQAPHTSRVLLWDIVSEFLSGSQWIKFYMLLLALLAIGYFRKWSAVWSDRKHALLLLLTLGILTEAAIFQVTSYTPIDNNIFFHSFAIAALLTLFSLLTKTSFIHLRILLTGCVLLMLWWSGVFWKYISRVAEKAMPTAQKEEVGAENVVNRHTYMLHKDTSEIPASKWGFSTLKAFEKIYLPNETVAGMERLMQHPMVVGAKASGRKLKVLNMTELTPLAVELPYDLETGPEVPLWYHLGVSMFNKDAERFAQRIRSGYYDIVLFEHIPNLNNFYPFYLKDLLEQYYPKADRFPAPRKGDTQGTIEIYIKETHNYAGIKTNTHM